MFELPASDKLSSLDDGGAKKLCASVADGFNGLLSDSDMKRMSCTTLVSVDKSTRAKPVADVAMCK